MEDYFNNNVNFVYKMAKRMSYNRQNYDDLVQAGLMGLLYASRKYDECYHTPFLSYASFYILGEMKRQLREENPILLSKEIIKIIREIRKEDSASISELEKKLDTSKENILIALSYMHKPLSLNCEAGRELLDKVSSNNDSRKLLLTEGINELEEEEKNIIFYRFFKRYSQSDLALHLNKTQSKVSRLEKESLKKLKKILLKKYL